MSNLIDRDALHDSLWHAFGESDEYIDQGMAKWDSGLWIRFRAIEEVLAKQPLVYAEPIKRGYWVRNANGDASCSVCEKLPPLRNDGTFCTSLYCPRCGARMEGIQK